MIEGSLPGLGTPSPAPASRHPNRACEVAVNGAGAFALLPRSSFRTDLASPWSAGASAAVSIPLVLHGLHFPLERVRGVWNFYFHGKRDI